MGNKALGYEKSGHKEPYVQKEEKSEQEAIIAKLMAETAKINAETSKINKETFWYPMLISTGFVGAIIALTKVFL